MSPFYENYRRLSRVAQPVHQGFIRCRIGPMPVDYEQTNDSSDPTQPNTAPPPEVTNALISDWTCPGIQIRYDKESHYKFVVNIPIQEDNEWTETLTVNMLCDNHYENWWSIHRYMETIMRGSTDAFPIRDINHPIYGFDHRYRNRKSYIPFIDIHCADDVAQEHQIVRFYRCRPVALAPLPMSDIRQATPMKFSVSFNFEIKRIIRLPDPNNMMSAICVATGGD